MDNDNVHVRDLIALVMNFAIPCALFSTIIRTSREDLEQQVLTVLMITLVFTVFYAASYLWARRSLKVSVSDASVLALTIGFPNSAGVALPLFAASYGSASTVTAALSIAVGAITISPLTAALLEADKQSREPGLAFKMCFVALFELSPAQSYGLQPWRWLAPILACIYPATRTSISSPSEVRRQVPDSSSREWLSQRNDFGSIRASSGRPSPSSCSNQSSLSA
jgi:predicted permease